MKKTSIPSQDSTSISLSQALQCHQAPGPAKHGSQVGECEERLNIESRAVRNVPDALAKKLQENIGQVVQRSDSRVRPLRRRMGHVQDTSYWAVRLRASTECIEKAMMERQEHARVSAEDRAEQHQDDGDFRSCGEHC